MGVFLYYLPGVDKTAVKPDLLRSLGLGEVLRDLLDGRAAQCERDLLATNVNARGPDGSSGAIVAAVPANGIEVLHPVGHYPDRQTWTQCGSYWLGTDNEDGPTARTLERSHLVEGYELELGDGDVWQCPVIRRPGGAANLPQAWGVSPAGEFQTSILREWEWAWQMAGEIWDAYCGAHEITTAEAFRFCCRLLGTNYRVGLNEVTRLTLITSANYGRVFKAAVDGELIETLLADEPAGDDAAAKKKEPGADPPGPVSSSPGPADGSPITAPAGESCT